MTFFVVLLLALGLFVCAAYPLLRRKSSYSAVYSGDDNLEELQSHRDTTYSMLKELDFDYQSGILSLDDYESLRGRYKRKAVSILKDIDNLEESTDTSDEIEEKVLALRKSKGIPPDDGDVAEEIERKVLSLRRDNKGKGLFCRQCGARQRPEDRFCAQCGVKLVTEGE